MKTRLLFIFSLYFIQPLTAQIVVPLWPDGKIPNSLNNTTIQEKTEKGKDGILRISDITIPSFAVYKADNPNGAAVLICPGGGYRIEAAGHEGTDIARWFNSFGVTAFVLKYRLPDQRLWTNNHEVPLQDALQAMRLIRQESKKYDIDPNRLGIMGFSAGGHLASTVCTHWHKKMPIDENTKPNFAILMYPVVSSGEFKHAGSIENLLSKTPSDEMLKEYSNEKQVSERTPPTLLVHATDDKAVPVENSLLYYAALKKLNIPTSLLVYENGGHGFGLATKQKGSVKNWPDHFKQWMNSMTLLKN